MKKCKGFGLLGRWVCGRFEQAGWADGFIGPVKFSALLTDGNFNIRRFVGLLGYWVMVYVGWALGLLIYLYKNWGWDETLLEW